MSTRVLLLFLVISVSTVSAKTPKIELSDGPVNRVASGPVVADRSEADSLLVMGPWGSGATFNGQFQNSLGQPDWNDWTHRDLTVPEEENHWHAHTYNAEGLAGHGAENLAAWCGSLDYPACEDDVDGGYGNYWNDALVWKTTVPDPSVSTVVTLDAWVNLDVELIYDTLSLLRRESDAAQGFVTIAEYDGQMINQHLTWEIDIPAGEYTGDEGNEVELRFVIFSDSIWSDEDCLYPSAGACQIDDITVRMDGTIQTFDDFEDGTLGNWVPVDALGSGDFSQLQSDLIGLDDCRTNHSPQVCFVDDGVVVPGTGGTWCIDWCYGPGGFIVNWSGGLIPNSYIENAIMSPVMPWPENHDGGLFEFDVYVHETLETDSPAILYSWTVRSTSDPNPATIRSAIWTSDNFYYYGGPEYRRHFEDLAGLIEPDATFVQVRLSIIDYPVWSWDWAPNGTPAPYFDNVRVTAVDTYGPRFVVYDVDLANDSFPESGVLDPDNLATNHVRFDSGRTSGSEGHDPIRTIISIQGDGTQLRTPALHYRLIPNEVFDSVRTSGLPNSGSVPGAAHGGNGYHFDLPDTGFFYPGDVIHYYFTASQETPGGLETVMVPADTSGFSQNPWGANSRLPGICTYDQQFSVRALPSMSQGGDHPRILIWDDSCDPDFTSSLRHDVNQAQAFTYHSGLDLYRTLATQYGSNMARVVSPEILAGYNAIFYFSGSNHWDILGNGSDEGLADLALLTQWLEEHNHCGLFVNGDHVMAELASTAEGQYILHDYLGATLVDDDLYPRINGNTRPQVLKMPAVPYFPSGIDEWIVTGYCPDSRAMNAIQPLGSAVRLAEFANPAGQGGSYPYSAMMVNEGPNQSLSFSMPYDLRRIQQLPGWSGYGVSLRSRILGAVTSMFSGVGYPVVDMTPVPDRLILSASAYPNPFNPATKISFNLPRSGHLNLKIYNVRGELVRTLADEPHEAGPGQIVWNGDDQFGSNTASGVYFYELSFGEDVITEKMMLVK